MGWEWRVFIPAESGFSEPPCVVGPGENEERTDIYLPSGPTAGIKLRHGERIEVKHLEHTTESLRIESWVKEKSRADEPVHAFVTRQLRSGIAYTAADICAYPRVVIAKSRRSSRRGSASVEQADLTIGSIASAGSDKGTGTASSESGEADAAEPPPTRVCPALAHELTGLSEAQLHALRTCSRWRSLCVEGSKGSVKEVVRHHILPIVSEWPEALVMGYPRFVHALVAARTSIDARVGAGK